MDRRRLPDLTQQRRPRGRRGYGSLGSERRRGPAAIWFSIALLVPVLLVTGFVWGPFGGSDEPGTSPVGTPDPSGAEQEPAPTISTDRPPGLEPNPTGPVPPGDPERRVNLPGITLPTSPPPVALGIPPPETNAAAAIVMDGNSMAVIYERNAHVRRQPASLTKIVTAMVAADHANLDDLVESDAHHWDLYDSTSMGLVPGDQMSMRNLLYGLMLVSGNDAAQVISRHVAGSEEAFVVAMNLLVERLQLQNTLFRNVHGLSEEGQYSTAYDLALLSRHLMENEALREIVGTEDILIQGTRDGTPFDVYLYNHNPLLNYTPGVDGVKTGFTEEAGRTFAASVLRDGHRIIVVLLDAPNRAQDAIDLIEWAYSAHTWEEE